MGADVWPCSVAERRDMDSPDGQLYYAGGTAQSGCAALPANAWSRFACRRCARGARVISRKKRGNYACRHSRLDCVAGHDVETRAMIGELRERRRRLIAAAGAPG